MTTARRRWFADDEFDLYVWADETGTPTRFQLCYGKPRHERALTWTPEGVHHDGVDAGDDNPTKNMTPVLTPDADVDWPTLHDRFEAASREIDPEVRGFVLQLLRNPVPLSAHPPSAPPPARAEPSRRRRVAVEQESGPWWRHRLLLTFSIMIIVFGLLTLLPSKEPAQESFQPGTVPPNACLDPDVPLVERLEAGAMAGLRFCGFDFTGELSRAPQPEPDGWWILSIRETSGATVLLFTDRDAGELGAGDSIAFDGSILQVRRREIIVTRGAFRVLELDPL